MKLQETLRMVRRGCAARKGLTLLELVVVLTILVAITGLVVPLLPNFVHRANIASCTTNISELDKWIQSYQSMYSELPDKMDNLVIGTGLASYVLDGSTGEYTSASFTPDALTKPEENALINAGITQLAQLIENPGGDDNHWSPTAWPYSKIETTAPTITALSTSGGTTVAVLTDFGERLMGLPTTETTTTAKDTTKSEYRYVIFGLNKACTLFRNFASEPPYHFADTSSEDPSTYYMPFAAVFMVSKSVTVTPTSGSATTTTTDFEQAKFMGSVAFHDFGLATGDSHTKEWWEQLKSDRPNK
jgi:type II secretory pathway pseudopilin PulG